MTCGENKYFKMKTGIVTKNNKIKKKEEFFEV